MNRLSKVQGHLRHSGFHKKDREVHVDKTEDISSSFIIGDSFIDEGHDSDNMDDEDELPAAKSMLQEWYMSEWDDTNKKVENDEEGDTSNATETETSHHAETTPSQSSSDDPLNGDYDLGYDHQKLHHAARPTQRRRSNRRSSTSGGVGASGGRASVRRKSRRSSVNTSSRASAVAHA